MVVLLLKHHFGSSWARKDDYAGFVVEDYGGVGERHLYQIYRLADDDHPR